MKHGLMFLSDYKIIYKPVLTLVLCLWQIKLISYINDILSNKNSSEKKSISLRNFVWETSMNNMNGGFTAQILI